MELQTEVTGEVHTPQELRTSSNNMLCIVTYEPTTVEEQAEIEELLAVAN